MISVTRYEYREDSGHREEIIASTMEEAIEEAEDLLRDGDWNELERSRRWVDLFRIITDETL